MSARRGLVLIVIAFISGGLIATMVKRSQRDDSTDAIIDATFADLGVKDFDELRAKMIAAPEKVWWTKAPEGESRKREFREWFAREQKTFPVTYWEPFDAVRAWLDGNEKYLDTIVTHEAAQYRVQCGRYEDGAECRIKLIGFTPAAPDR